jgi:hypothetical protein
MAAEIKNRCVLLFFAHFSFFLYFSIGPKKFLRFLIYFFFFFFRTGPSPVNKNEKQPVVNINSQPIGGNKSGGGCC